MLPDDEIHKFVRMDLHDLIVMEDLFDACCAGGHLVFDGDNVDEMETVGESSVWNLSTMTYHMECPVSQAKFIEIVRRVADMTVVLQEELKTDTDLKRLDRRLEYLLTLSRFCHGVGQFIRRVSGVSLMSTCLKPVRGRLGSDPNSLLVMNSYSFPEWSDWNDETPLDAILEKWRGCVCSEGNSCSKDICGLNMIFIALFGPCSR